MIENAQNRQFLLCIWPQYHFSMVFMMVYIDSCSLLVCQMNIYWDITHIDVDWRQFDVKMIENTQNRQFLSCKWPQYHFSMLFMKVYINSCSLLMCQMNIYRDSTHTDVNWRPFSVENDRKYAKSSNFVMQVATIPLFNGLLDGYYRFLPSVSMSDKYLLKWYT